MSLLLDALKKAAQEKLDKEKLAEQTSAAEGSGLEQETEIAQPEAGLGTQIDSTAIDATSSVVSASDQTEMDNTSVTGLAGDETRIGEPSEIFDATQIETADKTKSNTELELELESDLTGLTIAPGALDGHSAADIQRVLSAEAERELDALDQDTTGDIHARGQRIADYDLGEGTQEASKHDQRYSASLTRNLQAEQQEYYSGSPTEASQLFNSKKPEAGKQKRLYLLLGLVILCLAILGAMFGWEYVAELKQSQIVAPIAKNHLDEPLSATLVRDESGQVDTALLIEQEDYSELLQETLSAYEDEPLVSETSDKQQKTKTAPTKQTVAGSKGEYRIKRSKKRGEPLHQILMRGYEAYQRGELDTAEIVYRQALTRAPRNRDALLGMAAISVARGETTQAGKYYGELLTLDPKDDLALAGLAGLGQQPSNVEAAISRVKLLLTEKPDSAHLHFTLGNLYASQSRWSQAQQAYFNAARLSEDNADYVFNLAVSLEHLGQNQIALRFYRQALRLTQKQRTHFDIALAQSRVQALSAK